MGHSGSIVFRAFLAVGLLVGFYLLALAIAGTLIYIDFAMISSGHFNIKVAFFCALGAGVILWSILPRVDRFEAPGPVLDEAENPELYGQLRAIAGDLRQELPSAVYLVGDVNAWVSERGGVMGIGSRRVMGVGLPLMMALTPQQFAAVLAHEFGHFDAGDTKLGPWIYRTRSTIARTIDNLGERETWLDKPFRWYGAMFMRVTQSISRQQEFKADEIAARQAGPENLIAGLRRLTVAGEAFQSFWIQDVAGLLRKGLRPPIVEGYSRFLASRSADAIIEAINKSGILAQKSGKYDSHPSIAKRSRAVRVDPSTLNDSSKESALKLLGNPMREEERLLRFVYGDENFSRLEPIAWSEIVEKSLQKEWGHVVNETVDFLGETPIRQLPEVLRREDVKKKIRDAFRKLNRGSTGPDESQQTNIIGLCVVGCALLQARVLPIYDPGEPIRFEVDGRKEAVFQLLREVIADPELGQRWSQFCVEAGISDLSVFSLVRSE